MYAEQESIPSGAMAKFFHLHVGGMDELKNVTD